MIASLFPLVLVFVALDDEQPKIDELEAIVQRHPDDLDAQLRLALLYSWRGDFRASRAHAAIVAERSPKYKDAQLLLARLDAWEGDYDRAKRRLEAILRAEPNDRDTRLQLLDVEVWSGDGAAARALATALIREHPTADLYYRLAQVDYERLHYYDAYLDAENALALDPTYAKALALRNDVHLVLAEMDLQIERLPYDFGPGHAEILTITALPRNHLSLTATEEFRHRFGYDNNRVALQFDWRQSKDFALTLLGALGAPAVVIPRATASVRGALQVYGPFDVAIGYTFDALPVDATLSRLRVDAGVRAIADLRGEASYTFGYYTQHGASDTTNAFQVRACWDGTSRACAFYAYGAETYGPVVIDPSKPLPELIAHIVGADLVLHTTSWLDLRIAADAELRTDATRIYRGTLGSRFWF